MRETPATTQGAMVPKIADFGIVNPEELEIVSIS
jgi:hypothetical protein